MGFEYKIENDEIIITGHVNKMVESIVIPDTIEGYPVTKIGNAFYDCYYIRKVDLPNTVTKIGSCVFPRAFIGLQTLTINNIEVKEGVNVINNRFIFYNGYTSNILYQINDDYVCDDGYFMDGEFKCYLNGLKWSSNI